MANEKSRNHESNGPDKGGKGKSQGKQFPAQEEKPGNTGSKPGPGKQARDQLNVRAEADSPGKGK